MKIEVKMAERHDEYAKPGTLYAKVDLSDEQKKIINSPAVVIDRKKLYDLIELGQENGIELSCDVDYYVNHKIDAMMLFATIKGEGLHDFDLLKIEEESEKQSKNLKWLKVMGIITIVMIALAIISEFIISCSAARSVANAASSLPLY